MPIAPLALLALLVPWASAKLVLLGALAAALAARVEERGVAAPRSDVRRCLWVVAFAVFVASPYWLIPRSAALRALALALSLALVAAWSRTGEELRIRAGRAGRRTSWLVMALLLLWHGPGLFAPIEFRGDEDLHMVRPLRSLEALAAFGRDHGAAAVTAALLVATTLGALAAARRRAFLAVVAPLAFLALALAWQFLERPPEPEWLLRIARYPVVGAWLHTLAAASPLDAGLPGVLHEEALYRLVPLLSAIGIGLLALRAASGPAALRAGAALLVATTPTLTYYSGVVYPDLTAAALVSAGLWGIHVALRRTDRAAAAPLLALGLLAKDSFPPTGVAVAAVACASALLGRAPRLPRALAFSAGLLALPVAYRAWRVLAERSLLAGSPMRGFEVDFSALANPALYAILARALLEQFGPLVPLALLGLATAWRSWKARAWAAALLAQLLLLAGDVVSEGDWGRLPGHWGYSRFALTLLPPFVCLCLQAMRWLVRRSLPLAAAALVVGLAWNVWARPVAIDGSRPPHWGDYVSETSGERYPYDDLYRWLAESGETRTLTIVGRDYSYRDDFYLARHGLRLAVVAQPAPVPRSELVLAGGPDRAALLRAHEAALGRATGAPGLVVLHVSGWLRAEDAPREHAGLKAVRVLKLGGHALVVYAR